MASDAAKNAAETANMKKLVVKEATRRLKLDQMIFSLQARLIPGGSLKSANNTGCGVGEMFRALQEAFVFMSAGDYDTVVEERNASRHCGYPPCARSLDDVARRPRKLWSNARAWPYPCPSAFFSTHSHRGVFTT